MNARSSIATLALVCAPLLAFSGAGAATPTPAPSPVASTPAGQTIHIKDFAFAPTPYTVTVGERVAFINDDDEAHTVTATDKSFDSEGLDGGKTWTHVFTKPGTYTYFCELHPYMKATIVVKARGA